MRPISVVLLAGLLLGVASACDAECDVDEQRHIQSWAGEQCEVGECEAKALRQLEDIVPDSSAALAAGVLARYRSMNESFWACRKSSLDRTPEEMHTGMVSCDVTFPRFYDAIDYMRIPQSLASLGNNVTGKEEYPIRFAVWRNARREIRFLQACANMCGAGVNCGLALSRLIEQRRKVDRSIADLIVSAPTRKCIGARTPFRMCNSELLQRFLSVANTDPSALVEDMNTFHRNTVRPLANETTAAMIRQFAMDSYQEWKNCKWSRKCRQQTRSDFTGIWGFYSEYVAWDAYEGEVRQLAADYDACPVNCFRFTVAESQELYVWRKQLEELGHYYLGLLMYCETPDCFAIVNASLSMHYVQQAISAVKVLRVNWKMAETVSWTSGVALSAVCCVACAALMIYGLVTKQRQLFQWAILLTLLLANIAFLCAWAFSSVRVDNTTARANFTPVLPMIQIVANMLVFLSLLGYLVFWVRAVHNDLFPSRSTVSVERIVFFVFLSFALVIIVAVVTLLAVLKLSWFTRQDPAKPLAHPAFFVILGAEVITSGVLLGYFIACFRFIERAENEGEDVLEVKGTLIRNFVFSFLLFLSFVVATIVTALNVPTQPIELDPWVHHGVTVLVAALQTVVLLLVVLTSWIAARKNVAEQTTPEGHVPLLEKGHTSVPRHYRLTIY